ncbi:hypothetical protein CCB81_01655 [Armatimonadetes bacterium Uphvl-Ar2]|nr:hypothetical protein CCB81_01655 [Armatimonadetes bacterium Uphvl-Ar2]
MKCVDSSMIARAYGIAATPKRHTLADHLTFLGHAQAANAIPPACSLSAPGKLLKLEGLFPCVTAILVAGAAVFKLAQQPTRMIGLQALGYPPTLVWILGPAKLDAVAALLHEHAICGIQCIVDVATKRRLKRVP